MGHTGCVTDSFSIPMIPQTLDQRKAEIERLLELPAHIAWPAIRRLGRMAFKPANSPLTVVQVEPVAPLLHAKPETGGPVGEADGGEAL